MVATDSIAAMESGQTPAEACRNCETPLLGPYCHVCGQAEHDHHRSLWRLGMEALEGLTDLDGRLVKTIVPLFFNPGKLARDYLDGRRARHVPPLRLFFVSLLIFMLVMETLLNTSGQHTVVIKSGVDAGTHTGLQGDTLTLGPSFPGAPGKLPKHPARPTAFENWLKPRLGVAAAKPDYYFSVFFTWAHRLAIVLLPVLAIALALAYARQRKFYFYDHLIVAMQFLSFEFLLFAIIAPIPAPLQDWVIVAAILWSPLNLFMLLRGAYGSGVPGALVKAAFLWVSTVIFSSVLMAALALFALREIGV